MFKALQSLGLTNDFHLVVSYAGDIVTVTATCIPKGKGADDKGARTLQVSGTVDEVEAGIAAEIAKGVDVVRQFQTNLAAIEADTAAAIKEAGERNAAAKKPKGDKPEKTKPKPEAAPAKTEAAPTAAPVVEEAGGLNLGALIEEANAGKK